MESKTHIGYYDFLKGIAIVMVVAIHTSGGFDFTTVHGNIRIVLRLLMNSAVPVFLAISGFFLAKKDLSGWGNRMDFWKKQIPKVYIPMLLWSLPLFLMSLFASDVALARSCIKLLLGGYSIYYFIILIIQCYLLLPFVQRYKNFSLGISLVLTTLSWWVIVHKLPALPLILYAGPFAAWIFYFVLGVFLSGVRNNYSIIFPVLLIFAGLILQYSESSLLFDYGRVSFGQKASSVVTNAGVILLMFSDKAMSCYRQNTFGRIFEIFGRNSFGIYLVHCYFILILSFMPDIKLWSIKCLIVFCSTFILICVLKAVLPKIVAGKYLGLR